MAEGNEIDPGAATVEVVLPDSGAEDAGLKGGTTQVVVAGESYVLGGDIIVEADGVSPSSLDKLRDVIRAKEPGDKVSLDIYRGEKKMSFEVGLGRQPTSPSG
jgi:S1-C subfamily serine protease